MSTVCIMMLFLCYPETLVFITVLRTVKMVGLLNFEVGFQVGFSNVCRFWWAFMIITVGYVDKQLAYRQEYERSRSHSTIGWREKMCMQQNRPFQIGNDVCISVRHFCSI
jgi:hypothetical protein